MPVRGNIFEIGQPVHIISHAVDGRNIFIDNADCFRFIFQIYAANIGKPIFNLCRRDIVKIAQSLLNGEDVLSKFIIKEHPPLVSFLDFSLVINHNHFYLVPNVKNAVPVLMRNLNNGFAQYFNLKHERSGVLFEGRYRAVITKTQFQADAVSRYVNTINPLDIFQPGWRENGLKDPEEAFRFLRSYQFSSFPDRIGERKSRILATPEILEKYLTIGSGHADDYKEFVKEFLKERSNFSEPFYLE